MRNNTRAAGFTVIELLTGIMLTGIIALSASNFFLSMASLQRRTLNNEFALRAASRQVETLRNSNYNSLVNGVDIDFSDELPQNLPKANGIVRVSEPTPGLKKVEVLVSYDDNGADKTVKLVTMIGQIGITQ